MTPHFKRWCERQATDWRYRLGLRAYDRLPADSLAREFSAEIVPPHEVDGASPETVKIFMTADPASWSAVILREKPLLIMYNPHHSAARYESNTMHELAHVILNHQPIRIDLSLLKRSIVKKMRLRRPIWVVVCKFRRVVWIGPCSRR